MTNIYQSTRCSECGEQLPEGFNKQCPKCGSTKKNHEVSFIETVKVDDSLHWQHIREYYERHQILLPIVFCITIGSPFLGLFLAGWGGVIVGLLISLITFFLGLRAVTKVREIHEGE